jgi:hypothetical protein
LPLRSFGVDGWRRIATQIGRERFDFVRASLQMGLTTATEHGRESESVAIVAQLVEHWIVIPGVAGSSPVIRPKQKRRRKPAFSFAVRS